MPQEVDVIVVGAGIAGLAAAHAIAAEGLSVRVLEAEPEPGGRARTTEWAGCVLERGAVYFTPRYRVLMRLVRAAGIEDRIVPLPGAFRSAVRRNGRWHHVDYQNFPTAMWYSALSPRDKASLPAVQLATLRARARMRFGDLATVAELDREAHDPMTESARDYFTRPVIEVFCGYRPEQVTFALTALAAWFPGRAKTFDGGIGMLATALARVLRVDYGVVAERVRAEGDGAVVEVRNGATQRARAVVVATPADVTARLWPEAPRYVHDVRYTDMGLLYLRTSRAWAPGYRGRRPLYMQLLPNPRRALHALCFANEAAAEGGLLVASASPEARAALDDDELARRLRAEAEELNPDLRGIVTDELVVRPPRVVASFANGGAARAAELRDRLRPGPVQPAGDYTHGVWMESAAQSGLAAAERVLDYLRAPVMSGAT